MRIEREVAASAVEIWSVLGERFGDLSWSRDIESSALEGELGVGAVRVCRFPPNAFSRDGEIRERLVAFDREALTMAYEVTEPTGVMRRAINRWSLEPAGAGRCIMRSHATMELRGLARLLSPIVQLMLRRMASRFLEDVVAQAHASRTSCAAA